MPEPQTPEPQTPEPQTTVHQILDELVGGVRIGDNVVLQADEVVDAEVVLSGGIRAAELSVVYISFRLPPEHVHRRFGAAWNPERFLLVDCYSLADKPSAAVDIPVRWIADPTPRTVREELGEISQQLGEGATYVFDGLTDMQQRWSSEDALSLFLWACPKLYEERTVAYWTLQRTAHTPSFLSQLAQVTQVVVDIGREEDQRWMVLRKAAGRPDDLLDGRVEFVGDDVAHLVGRSPRGQQRVGRLIKAQRTAAGLSQAELARKVGVSPSALSQTERGRHGISGDVLMRVWEVLGVPLGGLSAGHPTHQVFPRSGRPAEQLLPGVSCETIVDCPDVSAHLLVFDPGASASRAPFVTKRREFAVALDGVLQLTVGRSEESLQQGDAALLVEPVRSWRNPAAEHARVLWILLP